MAIAALSKRAFAAEMPILLELFTSQGCSDCPAADKLLGELKSRPGVEVVSLNVDYWDYLGWHDTLGKPEYTKRQQDYAKARGDNEVYTPQVVVNGERHAVGSSKSQIDAAITAARASFPNVPIMIKEAAHDFEISVGALAGESGTLWVLGIAPDVKVAISKGENAGNTITYHNVARRMLSAGHWDGEARIFTVPQNSIYTPDCRACFAVLQRGAMGKVLGLGTFKEA